MNQIYEANLPYETKLTWGALLSRTYGLYRDRFWIFFRIGLPAALLTYLFASLQHMLIRQLLAALGLASANSSTEYWVLLTVWTFVVQAVYWLLSTIFFGAIAGDLLGAENEAPAHISDAYSLVRNRLGPLLVIGTLTWVVFFAGRGIALFAWRTLLDRVHFHPSGIWGIVAFGLPLIMLAGLLARAGLAVPELMANPASSVMDSIRSSIKKTENWEFFFMFFVSKSAIIGYGVYWLTDRGLDQLWHTRSIGKSAYDWIALAVYICLFAALESPLFIAFSFLYRDSQSEQKTLNAVGVIA